MQINTSFRLINGRYLNTLIFTLVCLAVLETTQHVFASEIDVSFNGRLKTASYTGKNVQYMEAQADGKVIATGSFNNYNNIPVGSIIRLNSDGSLDPTFNNSLDLYNSSPRKIIVLPKGRILLVGSFLATDNIQMQLLSRLLQNGEADQLFNSVETGK